MITYYDYQVEEIIISISKLYSICNKFIIFYMKLLKHHQIKQQELKLLETYGRSLADYGNTSQEAQTNSNTLNNIVVKSICQLQIKSQKHLGNDSNANLRAFMYVLLHKIYAVETQENLLTLLKSAFYNSEVNLCLIKGHELQQIPNIQMKKLVVEFFYLLGYSFFDDKVESKLKKYPIIMNIFILFLRTILFNLGFKESLDYKTALSTQETFKALSQFFNMNMSIKDNIFSFDQISMVIAQLRDSDVYVGNISHQKQKKYQKNVSPGQKTTIRIDKPTVNFSYSEAPNSPASIPIKRFFTNKSIKIEKEAISNASIKTNQSFKDFRDAIMKKTKSLKDYPKRKYSNLDQPVSFKSNETNEFTKTYSSKCNCGIKKRSKMLLSSNLYQFNVQFVSKESQATKVSCKPQLEGNFYVSSKGIACELYETRKVNSFMKNFFQEKRQQKQQNCNINDPVTVPDLPADSKPIKSSPVIHYQPMSKCLQKPSRYDRPQSKFIQEKTKATTEPSQYQNQQDRNLQGQQRNQCSAFINFFSKKII